VRVYGIMFQQYGLMFIQYTYVVLDLFFPNTRMEKIIKVGQQLVVENRSCRNKKTLESSPRPPNIDGVSRPTTHVLSVPFPSAPFVFTLLRISGCTWDDKSRSGFRRRSAHALVVIRNHCDCVS
jgi:hypothetical protein